MKKLLAITVLFLTTITIMGMERSFSGRVDVSEKKEVFYLHPDILQQIQRLPATTLLANEELLSLKNFVSDITIQAEQTCDVPLNEDLENEKCSLCDTISARMRLHERQKHNKNTYVCMRGIKNESGLDVLCLDALPTKQELKHHRSLHERIRCPLCGVCILHKNLNTHYKEIHCINGVFCLLCNPIKLFTREFQLYQHLKKEHQLLKW